MRNPSKFRLSVLVSLCASLGVACGGDEGTEPINSTDVTPSGSNTTGPVPSSTGTVGPVTSVTPQPNPPPPVTTMAPIPPASSTVPTTSAPPTTVPSTTAPVTSGPATIDDTSSDPGTELTPMTFEEVTAFLDDYSSGSSCFDCHRTQGDLPYVFKKDDTLYDTLLTSIIEHCNDRKLVEPGKPDESALYLVLYGDCEDLPQMPHGCYESPDGLDNSCAPYEARERLKLWIEGGALKE